MSSTRPTPIVAVTLTVNGAQPSLSFTFSKSSARVVSIGRKSAQSKDDYTIEEDRALFRCPVVSRKHATITFAEFGNVYITDLRSHHGTHILRRGETVARTVTPEVPHVLVEGDIVTFGKSVGKDQSLVRPVSVIVSLQSAPDAPASPLPEVLQGSPQLHPDDESIRVTSSGRFGVFFPSSDGSISSDSESELEDITSPMAALSQEMLCAGLPSVHELVRNSFLVPPLHGFNNIQFPEMNPNIPEGSLISPPSPLRISLHPPVDRVQDTGDFETHDPVYREPHPALPRDREVEHPKGPLFVGGWPYTVDTDETPSPASSISADDCIHPHVSSVDMEVHPIGDASDDNCSGPVVDVRRDGCDRGTSVEGSQEDDGLSDEYCPAPLASSRAQSVEAPVDLIVVKVNEEKQSLPPPSLPLQTPAGHNENPPVVVCEGNGLDVDPPDELQHDAYGRPAVVPASDIAEVSEELPGSVSSLKEVLTAAEGLRTQFAENLEAIRMARAEVDLLVAKMKSDVDTSSKSTSLKRKRLELDPGTSTPVSSDNGDRATKRRRVVGGVISAIAHTTAIATFGAVFAWSALAYL